MSGSMWTAPPSAGAVTSATWAAQEAVARARIALLAAAQVGWVSSAATAYALLVDEALADVARVAAQVDATLDGVLPHARAADAARAAAAEPGADLRAALRDLGRGGPGLTGLRPAGGSPVAAEQS